MSKIALIFHHTDNDGYGAAKVCLNRCRAMGYDDKDINCIYVTLNGGQIDFIEHMIRSYNTDENEIGHIFIVDLSIPTAEDIIRLGEVIREVNFDIDTTWIDHHKTSVDAYLKLFHGIEYNGIHYNKALFQHVMLDTNVSAAKLAWQTLFNENVPQVLELISDHDIFAHELEGSLEFFNGSGLFPLHDIKDPLWDDLIADGTIWGEHIDQIVSAGDIIGQYINGSICPMIGRNMQIIKVELKSEAGSFYFHNCAVINSSWGNSALFGKNGEGYKDFDLCIKYFQNKNGEYTYTIYSDKFDVTPICKFFGGGGHPGAGGFTLNRNIIDDVYINKALDGTACMIITGLESDVIYMYLKRQIEIDTEWQENVHVAIAVN